MRNSCGAKRALPFSSNPQDGAMGEAGIHSHPAEASDNEASTVSPRQTYVSKIPKRNLLEKTTRKTSRIADLCHRML